MKIAVGLSGGVDSAVAAYLLKKEGHEISGITMSMWDKDYNNTGGKKLACFSSDNSKDVDDIKKICEILDIPLYQIDLIKEFNDIVLNYLKNEYLEGRTPNPCVICNQKIKFDLLLKKAKEAGVDFDYFATGHYAKIEYDKENNLYNLKKAVYLRKDQSYFLTFLTQDILAKILFPLGNLTKDEVRNIAKEIGLPVHDKEESMDFFSGEYKELIDSQIPGVVVDINNKVLGHHNGIGNYTIGQRKGLGISSKAPLYVVEIDRKTNKVIVGDENYLYKEKCVVKNVNWISIIPPKDSINANVRIRYRHEEAPAKIIVTKDKEVEVKFETPQKSVTPGQIAVFYKNDIVLGGGIIESNNGVENGNVN